jgi:hypothetical protein
MNNQNRLLSLIMISTQREKLLNSSHLLLMDNLSLVLNNINKELHKLPQLTQKLNHIDLLKEIKKKGNNNILIYQILPRNKLECLKIY